MNCFIIHMLRITMETLLRLHYDMNIGLTLKRTDLVGVAGRAKSSHTTR